MRDLTNQRFGKLVAAWPAGKTRNRGMKWLCFCDCGNFKVVAANHLQVAHPHTISCGCLGKAARIQGRTIHGRSHTAEYTSFANAKQRCNNANVWNYERYGGRGIKFLFRSFVQFYKELGPRPAGMTLDRINNDGNYEPGNVRWATLKEQQNNRGIS